MIKDLNKIAKSTKTMKFLTKNDCFKKIKNINKYIHFTTIKKKTSKIRTFLIETKAVASC